MKKLQNLRIWLIEKGIFQKIEFVLFTVIIGIIFYSFSFYKVCPVLYALHNSVGDTLYIVFLISVCSCLVLLSIMYWNKYLITHYFSLLLIFTICFLIVVFATAATPLWFYAVILGLLLVFWYLWKKDKSGKEENDKYVDHVENANIHTDIAITDRNEDELGRGNFINNFISIFSQLDKRYGQKIVLSGGWGDGKTSCLNIVLKELKETHHIIEISPWFNDTKEKLLSAVLDQINTFTKDNNPYYSINSETKNLLELVKVDTGWLSIQLNDLLENKKKTEDVVSEIGDILKKYDKRVLISFDDLDRLPKDNILSILQITQLFTAHSNIIFVLSMDISRVEQILCESGESCSKSGNIKNLSQYDGYIEKIASIVIELPKPREYFVKKYLMKSVNKMLKRLEVEEIPEEDVSSYISTSRFKNIRDAKRFINSFYISFVQVKGEVCVTDYFNITALYLFYPDVYKKLRSDSAIWFKKDISEEGKNETKKYFDSIFEKYPEDQIDLKNLIAHITPAPYFAGIETGGFEIHKPDKSYLRNGELNDRYFSIYFNHNFSEDRIPDVLLDDVMKTWTKIQHDKSFRNRVSSFLVSKDIIGKWGDLFEYLIQTYNGENIAIYKTVIIELARLTKQLEMDYIRTFETVRKKIDALIYSIFHLKNHASFAFSKEVLSEISSISFKMLYFIANEYFAHMEDKKALSIIGDELTKSIEKDPKASIESILALDKRYLYSYIRNWHIGKKLEVGDPLVKERVSLFAPIIFGDVRYFWAFIGGNLKVSMSDFFMEDHFSTDEHEKSIEYYFSLWGKDKIKSFIKENKSRKSEEKDNLIELEKLFVQYEALKKKREEDLKNDNLDN